MPTHTPVPQTAVQPPTQPPVPTVISLPAIAGTPAPVGRLDIASLRARRSELSSQINSATSRREEAAEALKSSPPGAARAGLEGRIAVLDQRIMQLETDIALNGQQLALAAAQGGGRRDNASTQPPQLYGPFNSGQLTGITIVSIVLVWAPLAFAMARVMLKRWAHSKPAPEVLEGSARLERMEQAVDAVAIEIERISEGQRFVTQLMAKREQVPVLAVGQAAAEPIPVANAQTVAR